jgi:integrase
MAMRQKKEREIRATAEAKAVGLKVEEADNSDRTLLATAVAEHLYYAHTTKSRRTWGERNFTLQLFLKVCRKKYLHEVDKSDFYEFSLHLRSQRPILAPRTLHNRCAILRGFLRANNITNVIARQDLPSFTEKEIAAYCEDELKALFLAATKEDRLAFQFFLGTGAREQEVQFACWPDVDFRSKTFTVTEKLDLGFTPKDKEERLIPLADSLVASLRARRREYPDARLIFTNQQGRPEGHFLRRLKKLALRAGLNCGHCVNRVGQSCAKKPVCKNWELHKFRKTFATMHHESGVSARTLQSWLGHSSLETTIAYLKISDVRSERTRALVNNTFAGLA